jgi:hypothetical protein
MPELRSFDYAVVRVVPRVERGEYLNVGIILFSRTQNYLDARVALDRERLTLLDPEIDPNEVEQHLAMMLRVVHGGPESGPIGQLSASERFHWLVSPRSTVIQTSPVHSGLCHDSESMLEHLLRTHVRGG